jgi:hypothetical protein
VTLVSVEADDDSAAAPEPKIAGNNNPKTIATQPDFGVQSRESSEEDDEARNLAIFAIRALAFIVRQMEEICRECRKIVIANHEVFSENGAATATSEMGNLHNAGVGTLVY